MKRSRHYLSRHSSQARTCNPLLMPWLCLLVLHSVIEIGEGFGFPAAVNQQVSWHLVLCFSFQSNTSRTCYEPPALLSASLLSLVALTDGLCSTPTIFHALLRVCLTVCPLMFISNLGFLNGLWYIETDILEGLEIKGLYWGFGCFLFLVVLKASVFTAVPPRQGPIIFRDTLFCLLAYLPLYCRLYLPSVWKTEQFQRIRKQILWNKEPLHTFLPQPAESNRREVCSSFFVSQLIQPECGSMLVIRGHSKDQGAPPPFPPSSIVLVPWPLS